MSRHSLRNGWKGRSTCGSSSEIQAPSRELGRDQIRSRTASTFGLVKASNFAEGFSPGEIALLSLPARVGGPGFTFIHDKRDNPLESTKGDYFTLDAFAASSYFGSRSETSRSSCRRTSAGRWRRIRPIMRSDGKGQARTSVCICPLDQHRAGAAVSADTRVLPPGSCPTQSDAENRPVQDIAAIPLPEQFFAGGGNSHRGFGLNQAGPRDPDSGFPVGGTAQCSSTIWNCAFPRPLCLIWERDSASPFFTIWGTSLLRRTTC